MGMHKNIIFPHYEELEQEFHDKNGRPPDLEESSILWRKAQEQWEEELYDQANMYE